MSALLVSILGGLAAAGGFLIKWLLERNKSAASEVKATEAQKQAELAKKDLEASQANLKDVTADLKATEEQHSVSLQARDKAIQDLRKKTDQQRDELVKNATASGVIEQLKKQFPEGEKK